MLSEFLKFVSSIKNQTKEIGDFYTQIETLEEMALLQNKTWLDQFNMTRIRELAFINAVHAADVDMTELFLNSTEVDINAKLESNANALIIAMLALHTRNTNLTGKDKDKLKEAYSKIAIMLINYGIALDQQELGEETALHLALSRNFTEVALHLVKKGALLTIKNNVSAVPIYLAAQNGYANVVEAMLEKDQSLVNIPMNDGRTPLYIASQNGHVKVVNLLLDYGAYVNAEKVVSDNIKITPLDVALHMCIKIIDFFKDIQLNEQIKVIDICTMEVSKTLFESIKKDNEIITLSDIVEYTGTNADIIRNLLDSGAKLNFYINNHEEINKITEKCETFSNHLFQVISYEAKFLDTCIKTDFLDHLEKIEIVYCESNFYKETE